MNFCINSAISSLDSGGSWHNDDMSVFEKSGGGWRGSLPPIYTPWLSSSCVEEAFVCMFSRLEKVCLLVEDISCVTQYNYLCF